MTPFQIEILMHFHCIAAPFPRRDAPIYPATLREFQQMGLVVEPCDVDRPKLTERGEAYIRALCQVPVPVARWVLPDWQPELNERNI